MAMIGRLLLRVLLVPLGMIVATLVATLVVLIGHGTRVLAMIKADPTATGDAVVDVLWIGPAVVIIFAIGAFIMMTGAVVSVLISEVFAIRSWIFHALSGGLWMALGWQTMERFREPYEFFNDPMLMVGAGVAAGFAYWLVAGWSAGFWKPVFGPAVPPAPPVPAGG